MQVIDHISGGTDTRIIAHFQLTEEQIAKVKEVLDAGVKLNNAIQAMNEVLPKETNHELYGNWDLIILDQPTT